MGVTKAKKFKTGKGSSSAAGAGAGVAAEKRLIPRSESDNAAVNSGSLTKHERRVQRALLETKKAKKVSKKAKKIVNAVARAEEKQKERTLVENAEKSLTTKEKGGAALANRQELKSRQKKKKLHRDGVASKNVTAIKSSSNLSVKQRQTLFSQELQHMHSVVQHPVFAANPLQAIQQHLNSTITKLQPLTPELGRAPRPPPKHASSGHRRKT
jgi:hypothetical protein